MLPLGMVILTSQRLLLQELQLHDLDVLTELCMDEEITKYMDYIKRDSKEEVSKWLEEMIKYNSADPRKSYNFAVIEKLSSKMVGWIGIGEPDKEGRGDMDFGYAILRQFQGRGYASEALKSLLEFAITLPGINTITGECDEINLASEKVMLNVGMKFESVTNDVDGITKHFSFSKLVK